MAGQGVCCLVEGVLHLVEGSSAWTLIREARLGCLPE